MAKSKITLYAIIVLLVIMIGQFFYYRHEMSSLRFENSDLKEEKKEELKRVRDSAFVEIDNIIVESNERFDSILNIPPTIKWRKYEKPIYIDRSLDDALDVISDYKYNGGTETKD